MRTLLAPVLAAVFLALPAPAAAYVDPTTGEPHASRITRSAEIPERNWLPGHRGVDLALGIGGDVLAAGDGTVAFAGVVAGTPVVSIDHADGIRTTYQPVYASVSVGDVVSEGSVIGRLAPAARGQHDGLHWGALTGKDAYINPLTLLDAPAIRLKPVDGPGYRRF
ncbi:M23 family metallopeptidase [Corynebacterium liangguodongii]|uniref:M23 family peptidase n=1 Tax=Corynebacterium liangguodongii TaxID=2079535 RepID=A0A2S0WEQ7_9CORY|nr:M23 family metallopeptidase [Corynebacterium liangguodongii]AWB84249.1 M23 family peptidase [Corynebacterium liangguodongii]PWC00258.1 M23 family peptidase [Corynebacterium liangguodongii]